MKIEQIENNEHARKLIAEQGITTDNVTDNQLQSLHAELKKSLSESDCYDGTYRANPLGRTPKYMTCRTNEWDNREAISFNRDGFIGFCGWASTTNTAPVLNAVKNWLNKL